MRFVVRVDAASRGREEHHDGVGGAEGRLALGPDVDEFAVHAMRRGDKGEWTSKNGEGPRWVGIKKPIAFLDAEYAVKTGDVVLYKRVIRCACCP